MKLRNWAFALAVSVFVAGAVSLEAVQGGFYLFEETTGAVSFQGRSSRGLPVFLGQGTGFPTVAITGNQPFNGEVYNQIASADDWPNLSLYTTEGATWMSFLTSGVPGSAHSVDDPISGAGGTGPKTLQGTILKKLWLMKYPGETFTLTGGGACSTTGLNFFRFDGVVSEYDVKGTQTACNSTWTENAGNIFPTDSTANDGYEIVWGGSGTAVGALTNAWSMTAGTDAFYARIRFDLPTITDTDELWFGWRNPDAYEDTSVVAYDTYAAIGFTDAAGDYATITELNATNATETDLSETNASNGDQITLDVLVDAGGQVTYQINGAADSSAVSFTFSDAEELVPFLWEQNVGSATAGALEVIYVEVGYGVPID